MLLTSGSALSALLTFAVRPIMSAYFPANTSVRHSVTFGPPWATGGSDGAVLFFGECGLLLNEYPVLCTKARTARESTLRSRSVSSATRPCRVKDVLIWSRNQVRWTPAISRGGCQPVPAGAQLPVQSRRRDHFTAL